jgi:hypothetical protein
MSPDAHHTARTAMYVVGGIVGLSIVTGIVMVAVVANAANGVANAPINGSLGAFPRSVARQVNSQLDPAPRR